MASAARQFATNQHVMVIRNEVAQPATHAATTAHSAGRRSTSRSRKAGGLTDLPNDKGRTLWVRPLSWRNQLTK
jgi:hypothetical protein